MNFEILSEITNMHQYDEIKIIGQNAFYQGQPYHFAAMVRKADQAQLFVLSLTNRDQSGQEAEPSRLHGRHGQKQTMRQHMKKRSGGSFPFLSKLITDREELEFGSAQSGSLDAVSQDDLEKTLLLAKLMDAGWKLPENSIFFSENWKHVECQQYQFQVPFAKLPQWKHAKAVWRPEPREHFVEKPVRIFIDDAHTASKNQTPIPFSITAQDGTMKDGICYINSVKREDVWQKQKELFENPVFQKNASEHMTAEDIEKMWELLEQNCPRGMYFVCIEYECTLDVSLQFYDRAYLDSGSDTHESSSSMVLLAKPDSPKGMHGLKLKTCVIQTPVTEETHDLEVELFEVCEQVCAYEHELSM